IEVGAAAPFIAALRPAVKTTGPCPLRCIVRRSTRLPNPADGHASPDHHEVVIAAVTGDHRRTEGEGPDRRAWAPLKRLALGLHNRPTRIGRSNGRGTSLGFFLGLSVPQRGPRSALIPFRSLGTSTPLGRGIAK